MVLPTATDANLKETEFLENNLELFREYGIDISEFGENSFKISAVPVLLSEINLKDFDSALPNTRLVGRVEGKKFIPYYDRRQIEQNGVKAPVLMWGDDLVDIHFMQIQGSAIAIMGDGSELRIGFADSNGRKFKGNGIFRK